ncbi:hypothetical protein SALBM311S_10797 [Streptomyces alboniger]
MRNGGTWSADGWTLPPALNIEYNPYDKRHQCYGLSRAGMVSWIKSFSGEVKRLTGRRPVIYTTAHWSNTYTGGSRAFAANHAPVGGPLRLRGRGSAARRDGRSGRSGSTPTVAACRGTRTSSTDP